MTKQELEIVFEEAKAHQSSICLGGKGCETYIYKGVQIIKDSDSIKIYKAQGMDYYNEIGHDYDLFKKGWRTGVYLYLKKKYNKDLDFLSRKIRDLMNTSSSYKKSSNTLKEIESCQLKRKNIVLKYTMVTHKLKTLNQQL